MTTKEALETVWQSALTADTDSETFDDALNIVYAIIEEMPE